MDVPFSEILQEAIDSGFTEPDPREDEMTWVESY
jgi:homoserine dehydrogenase